MTDYFVGPGGNDGNDGLSWANRFLTLNGAEDEPIASGDTVYVGPGVYRETLTTDIDGASGSPVTYIGDVTGENTDSIGGIVRVTGSDDDQSTARTTVVNFGTGNEFRTFRGFLFDFASTRTFDAGNAIGMIIEDCVFGTSAVEQLLIDGALQADCTLRRCLFWAGDENGDLLEIGHSSDLSDIGHLIENCIFIGMNRGDMVSILNVGGITFRNSFFHASSNQIRVQQALAGGQTITVNNCIFQHCATALTGTVTGEITEDFNTFFGNNSNRGNTDTGGNSVTYPALHQFPLLFDGQIMPWWTPYGLSEWSQIGRIAGTGEATDDMFGVARPTTSAKNSWGPIQLREAERETGTVQTGSAALTLADAGDHQIYVPVTATSTTFEIGARYESEYAGTLPRLIVRQPGQADQVDTMVAAADTWETLSLTFTPNATPPYVIVILRSLNTSVTGDFDTYWDDLDVS